MVKLLTPNSDELNAKVGIYIENLGNLSINIVQFCNYPQNIK